jgi:hypothetical protein
MKTKFTDEYKLEYTITFVQHVQPVSSRSSSFRYFPRLLLQPRNKEHRPCSADITSCCEGEEGLLPESRKRFCGSVNRMCSGAELYRLLAEMLRNEASPTSSCCSTCFLPLILRFILSLFFLHFYCFILLILFLFRFSTDCLIFPYFLLPALH